MLKILFWGVLVNLVGALLLAIPIVALGWEAYLDNRPWLALVMGLTFGLLVDGVMWRLGLRTGIRLSIQGLERSALALAAVAAYVVLFNPAFTQEWGWVAYVVTGVAVVSALTDFDHRRRLTGLASRQGGN